MTTDGAELTANPGSHSRSSTVNRILDSTREMAAAGGYDAIQMRKVARAAGVAVGTLYHAFPSKTHLLLASLGRELDRTHDVSVEVLGGAADPYQRLQGLISSLTAAMQRNVRLSEAMARAVVSADASAASQVDEITEQIGQMVAKAVDNGEPSEHRQQVARLIVDIAVANLIAWLNGRASLDEMNTRLDRALQLLVDGSFQ